MFGNRLGWGISAVLVLLAGLLAYQFHQLGQPTPSTGELAAYAKVPPGLAELARPMLGPSKPLGDAGNLYRAAAAAYAAHAADYDAVADQRDYKPAELEPLKAFADLIDATDLPAMDLYASKPGEIINYDQTVPSLEQLEKLGDLSSSIAAAAAYKDTKDYDAAKRYCRATLSLGLHLYQERLTYGELRAGMDLMSVGAAGLGDVAAKTADQPLADQAAAFDKAKRAEFEQLKKTWSAFNPADEEKMRAYAGDFFQLAADPSVDPVWRIEAVRRLGRLKLNAAKLADNLRATVVVRTMAEDKSLSPPLHQAAEAARKITPYENQSAR